MSIRIQADNRFGEPIYMTGKKFGLMTAIIIIAAASTPYILAEMDPAVVVSNKTQWDTGLTFAESVDKAGAVVIGEIVGLDVKLFTEEIAGVDENGDEFVRADRVPMKEIKIRILEKLADDVGLDPKTITVYDRLVWGEVGTSDGHKAVYMNVYAFDYNLGDKGVFLIENDRRLYVSGFADYYPIVSGKTTVTTELDKVVGHDPIDLTEVRDAVRLKVQR